MRSRDKVKPSPPKPSPEIAIFELREEKPAKPVKLGGFRSYFFALGALAIACAVWLVPWLERLANESVTTWKRIK